MTLIRKAALACVASALLALPLTAAAQGLRNQDTFFTFSQSVELPDKTLPAGTYLFQLADSPSNRHIVKIMSEDRKQIHATLMAIPFYTNDRPSDEPQVRFMETPAQAASGSGTNAIKVWFYPGRTVGHEFIYPRAQAMRIAARTNQPVLTTKSETEISETVADADLTRVDRSGADSAVSMEARTETTTAEPEASASATAQAQVETPRTSQAPADTTAQTTPDRNAAPMRDRDTDTARTDLPNTASLLPLLAVIGIGSLVGSRWLRRSRRV
jgi:hypothetical protein